MGSKGATEAEREAHIGWQSTVQSRHYSSLKHTAMNARTPHLLAGRSGRDKPPHPMWQCLGQAPGDGYWQRVRALAAAAGYVAGPSDPQFQQLVTERIAAGNPEREDSPAYLLKRLKELEQGTRLCVKRSAAAPRTPPPSSKSLSSSSSTSRVLQTFPRSVPRRSSA